MRVRGSAICRWALLAVFTSGCLPTLEDECDADDGCAAGETCTSGVCVSGSGGDDGGGGDSDGDVSGGDADVVRDAEGPPTGRSR
ncbi:MAG: hypothetical protein ACYTF3_09485 [Planctomycetota bacterium]|jgi:hypothetical protein